MKLVTMTMATEGPWRIAQRGGRLLIEAPDGAEIAEIALEAPGVVTEEDWANAHLLLSGWFLAAGVKDALPPLARVALRDADSQARRALKLLDDGIRAWEGDRP